MSQCGEFMDTIDYHVFRNHPQLWEGESVAKDIYLSSEIYVSF